MYDKICVVQNRSSEWHYMWKMLGDHPINSDLHGKPKSDDDPTVAYNEGEMWEYMDTGLHDGEMKHCFRHRFHPKTKTRVYVEFPVSNTFDVSEWKV